MQVHKILKEAGLDATIEKKVKLARGNTSVDVYAEDPGHAPPSVIMCECKLWAKRVPQSVVRAFRQEVHDHGANLGLIISKVGFQSGARAAAEHSNVRLVTWDEFQNIYARRWFETYFLARLREKDVDPFLTYTEPLSGHFPNTVCEIEKNVPEFLRLHELYAPTGALITYFAYGRLLRTSEVFDSDMGPRLPLKAACPSADARIFPSEVADADSLRGLLDALVATATKMTAEFRAVCKPKRK